MSLTRVSEPLTQFRQTAGEVAAAVTRGASWKAPGNILGFEAVGDDSTDNLTAITNALAAAALSTEPSIYVPAGIYRVSDRSVLTSALNGITIRGEGYKSQIRLTGTHSANKGVFVIPADGDPDGGSADGASNVTIKDIHLDGGLAVMSSGVSGGIRAFYGEGHIFQNIWAHDFTKQGILLESIGGASVFSATVNNAYCYSQDTAAGQGISIATQNVLASRIVLNNVFCWDNGASNSGLGIDLSEGSATINNAYCWGNAGGGMKNAGNDNQHLILNNCDFSDNGTGSGTVAQGYYTNGTFRLLELNNVRAEGNDDHGIQIAHAGQVIANNIYCRNNGDIGWYVSAAADVQVDNLVVEENGTQGANFADASVTQAGRIRSVSNGRQGVHVPTTGLFHAESIKSVNDCTLGTDTAAVNFQAPSGAPDIYVAAVNASDADSNVTNAVSVNSQSTRAMFGKIEKSGTITNEISDSGTDTIYLAKIASGSAYTTGAHASLRDFTGTTTAAEALQLVETLVDDLKNIGIIK